MTKRNPYDENRLRLRLLLAEERKKQKLSQKELAQRLGKPQSFVSKYENGDRNLDIIEIFEVCDCMEISPLNFLKDYQRKFIF